MQTRSWKWTPLFYIQRFSKSRLQLKFRIYFSSMEKEKRNSRQKKSQGLWKSQNSNEMHLSLYFFHLVNIEGLIRCDIKASIADKVHQSCQGQNEEMIMSSRSSIRNGSMSSKKINFLTIFRHVPAKNYDFFGYFSTLLLG